MGSDTFPFERIDGVAENFHTLQNRELLEKLATETGGRYWKPEELGRLPSEISYSDAGISVRDIKELWNMPVVFRGCCCLWRRNGCCGASGVWYETCPAVAADGRSPRACSVYYVTVAGLGGEPDYEQRFTANAKDLDKLFKHTGNGAHVYTLTGSQATKAQLTQTLASIARDAQPEDDFVLILIGHGSYDGNDYKFNLVGPDITAQDLAGLCDRIPARRQLIVNTTSSAADQWRRSKNRGVE